MTKLISSELFDNHWVKLYCITQLLYLLSVPMRDLLFLLSKCFFIIAQNVLTRVIKVSDYHYKITVAKQNHKYLIIAISIEM